MHHLLLIIQYCGTHYHGFQVQKNACSVAQAIQDGVERIFGERLDIKGCSRTDAGVHANRYVLTLQTKCNISCSAVIQAMNVNLPKDIAVLECHEVQPDFHPRYTRSRKRYIYKIWNTPVKNVFLSDLALHWKYPLDANRMNEAAQAFVGVHDFLAFSSAGRKPGSSIRTIFAAQVTRQEDMVMFSVTGSGFLYNMVRIMAGTLLEVDRGSIAANSIEVALESHNRVQAGFTAPPHGLYLDEVFYE